MTELPMMASPVAIIILLCMTFTVSLGVKCLNCGEDCTIYGDGACTEGNYCMTYKLGSHAGIY